MSSYEEQELRKLADALTALTPRPAHLDRDGLLFEAGRRAARPARFWPWLTGGAAAVAVCLAVVLAMRPEPATVVRWVPAPPQPTPTPKDVKEITDPSLVSANEAEDTTLPPESLWRWQQAVRHMDIERVPMTPAEPPPGPQPGRTTIPSVAARNLPATLWPPGDN